MKLEYLSMAGKGLTHKHLRIDCLNIELEVV